MRMARAALAVVLAPVGMTYGQSCSTSFSSNEGLDKFRTKFECLVSENSRLKQELLKAGDERQKILDSSKLQIEAAKHDSPPILITAAFPSVPGLTVEGCINKANASVVQQGGRVYAQGAFYIQARIGVNALTVACEVGVARIIVAGPEIKELDSIMNSVRVQAFH